MSNLQFVRELLLERGLHRPARITRPERRGFPALTGIRFPLALWVVSYHLSGRGHLWESLTSYPPVATVMSHAYVSLGAFFALSGFLLTEGYSRRRWTQRETARYFIARFSRIYPLYLVSLIIVAPIIGEQLRTADLGDGWRRAGILFDYLFLLQGWTKLPVDWNTPAWSLSCEMFFYACFPLLVLMLRSRRAASTLLMAALAFGIPVLVHSLGLPDHLKVFTYLGDFVAGMAAAAFYDSIVKSYPQVTGHGSWFYVPALLSGGFLVLFGQDLHPWLLFDESMRLVNMALVLGLALGGGLLMRLLSSGPFLIGGRASYAIYILHVPILWFFKRSSIPTAIPPIPAGLAYLLLVLSLSLVISRFVEYPSNTFFREALGSLLVPNRTPERASQTSASGAKAVELR